MGRAEKVEFVEKLSEKLKGTQSLILTDFKGLTVAEMTELRSKLRERAVEMRVVKNRLLKRALSGAGLDPVDKILVGNTAISFGIEDPSAPAKVLVEYAKGNQKLVIKGGLLEGKALDLAGVDNLSKMPGRRELLAIMAGDFKQPATKLASACQAMVLKVAHAMQALARQKEEAEADEAPA